MNKLQRWRKDIPLTNNGLFRHCVLLSIMFWTQAIPWLTAKPLMQATWVATSVHSKHLGERHSLLWQVAQMQRIHLEVSSKVTVQIQATKGNWQNIRQLVCGRQISIVPITYFWSVPPTALWSLGFYIIHHLLNEAQTLLKPSFWLP